MTPAGRVLSSAMPLIGPAQPGDSGHPRDIARAHDQRTMQESEKSGEQDGTISILGLMLSSTLGLMLSSTQGLRRFRGLGILIRRSKRPLTKQAHFLHTLPLLG